MNHHPMRELRLILSVIFMLSLMLVPATVLAQGSNPTPEDGYYYVIERGDTWSTLSQRTGVTVATLKAINPHAIHAHDWLWVGDRLFIPSTRPMAPRGAPEGYWYTVEQDDTWNTVSRAVGVPVSVLWKDNPDLVRANLWLYLGDQVWIPGKSPAAETAAEATGTTAVPIVTPYLGATVTSAEPEAPVTATPVPAVTATQVPPTPVPTATQVPPTAAPTATQVPATSTATATPVPPTATSTATAVTAKAEATSTLAAASATPSVAATGGTGCPIGLAVYPDAIAAQLKRSDYTLAGLKAWLTGCGMISAEAGSVTEAPIQSPDAKDLVIIVHTPTDDLTTRQGLLLVYHSSAQGYSLARKVESAGTLALLGAADINSDGKPDLVWTDTTCGAHTCYATLFVESWDGKGYANWIDGEPSMAYGEYTFQDTLPAGSGEEIIVHGGIIESAGAGPQRAWTETYASVEGGPYKLVGRPIYDKSDCLYHRILDADQLFNDWGKIGFNPALIAYQSALDDKSLKACWNITDEVATLRDFARFRLVVANVAAGKSKQAPAIKAQIQNKALLGAANTFLDSYKANGSIVQACRDTTTYAKKNPGAWSFLADWGYANPTFTPEELCPLG
jgi:hypothetical protein